MCGVTRSPMCRAARVGPSLQPMAKIVSRYRSPAWWILGSLPESGPKCRVKWVQCSMLASTSSTHHARLGHALVHEPEGELLG